jgi:hypothetical protein
MQLLKKWIKRNFPGIIYRKQRSGAAFQAMVAQVEKFKQQQVSPIWLASHDIFTYHGEDGIIYYLLNHLRPASHVFVDIGSGDCVKSNCANLATHLGWSGLFMDSDPGQLAIGKIFYKQKLREGVDIRIVQEEVEPGNVNEILRREGIAGEIGLLSIDIDGNDYWVWKAIDSIQPAIVVIEAKIEFGDRDLIVPYGKQNHHSADKMYNGASVEAFRKLGEKKGYKLVGANQFGYNLFFVKKETIVKEASVNEILNYQGVKDCFYPESFFLAHTFVTE